MKNDNGPLRKGELITTRPASVGPRLPGPKVNDDTTLASPVQPQLHEHGLENLQRPTYGQPRTTVLSPVATTTSPLGSRARIVTWRPVSPSDAAQGGIRSVRGPHGVMPQSLDTVRGQVDIHRHHRRGSSGGLTYVGDFLMSGTIGNMLWKKVVDQLEEIFGPTECGHTTQCELGARSTYHHAKPPDQDCPRHPAGSVCLSHR